MSAAEQIAALEAKALRVTDPAELVALEAELARVRARKRAEENAARLERERQEREAAEAQRRQEEARRREEAAALAAYRRAALACAKKQREALEAAMDLAELAARLPVKARPDSYDVEEIYVRELKTARAARLVSYGATGLATKIDPTRRPHLGPVGSELGLGDGDDGPIPPEAA